MSYTEADMYAAYFHGFMNSSWKWNRDTCFENTTRGEFFRGLRSDFEFAKERGFEAPEIYTEGYWDTEEEDEDEL